MKRRLTQEKGLMSYLQAVFQIYCKKFINTYKNYNIMKKKNKK